MSEWKEYKLGDLVDVKGGKRLPKGKALSSIPTKHPYIRVRDLNNRKIELQSYFEYVDDETFKSISRYVANTNDVLLSIVGTIGEVAIVGESLNNASLTENCVKLINLQNILPNFLFYYLLSPIAKEEIEKGTVGAVQKKLPIKNIQRINLSLPPLDEQKKIADILSSLDDKIETNRKISASLEELAQALFKSWFIDFEPFGRKKPEDWEEVMLSEIGDIIGGGTPSKEHPEFYTTPGSGIPWITPKDLSDTKAKFTAHGVLNITDLGYEKSSAKKMPTGSILFSSRAPIGYISIALNEICTNQGFKSFIPRNVGTAFSYYLLQFLTPEIENKSTGSTFKEASGSLMKGLKISLPTKAILKKFEDACLPIFNVQRNCEIESVRLAELRDALLPKLMSGEIKVV